MSEGGDDGLPRRGEEVATGDGGGARPAGAPAVRLQPVDAGTWRGVADLEVSPVGRAFVAHPARYLALCCYGEAGWSPLAVLAQGRVVGFLMWAVDPADGACWLGGVLVDRAFEGRGYGEAAVRAALERLSSEHGQRSFALSYAPANDRARRLYARVGFEETGEVEDDEAVARLTLLDRP